MTKRGFLMVMNCIPAAFAVINLSLIIVRYEISSLFDPKSPPKEGRSCIIYWLHKPKDTKDTKRKGCNERDRLHSSALLAAN